MKNKTFFMTGATSGLGKEAAINLANKGATIIALSRNKKKGNQLIELHQKINSGKGKIELIEGNLSSFDSVKKACKEVKSKFNKLDGIILNAGIMNFSSLKTENNIEETLQVNLLSPLLICHYLVDLLKNNEDNRIIFTASALHQGNIKFNDIEFSQNFSGFKVYRQSKLGVILTCRLLSQKLSNNNINIYSQHPGLVKTELGRSAGWFSKLIFSLMGISAKKGAKNLIYLSETSNTSLISGEYYANKKIKKITPQSYDINTARNLLNVCEKYLHEYIDNESLIFNQ
jgi:NAD(P)-dependent dehydrogenase (short-subunit alcohol dehydrogenase family)